ncbi:3-hydroxyacyl-CoA dehydrogenase NAD-binding domain-containing protein [Alloyangia pacifica]|uniref:3-hydroxyacyl-CoA dehydrogenase / enoyl-CoA hydratase / 3-hydroxybutyryl-CoA epimerase n=1 Tax=Alloyangia pacifica TaxID=311180 RepID=A0A1I6TNN0_9RHOB|nr:3-hydroxyacyl-CoA dehydrogenase NAD-binding domain-containing protein [Alloyangia pacifica]SDH12078.1 3-hydroxyacyl-CoA dehydrogenase / enoyl-CoA hydratase / 3-hydroxybutyryl-CoA epimerase [Alloyangia pacifica]SFS90833.1 3-hydroxyacyl-CoA dehydrogenase / enoyl-CoA hydratase / 3-hydroxybutyryl-CoA epimerase [Alloyangia pacifica]
MSDFSASTEGGVCTIAWDTPGKSMNVMSLEALSELDALVGAALEDAGIRGIVITSAKPGSFAGGMDLKTLAAMREATRDDPARSIFEGIMGLHAGLRRIERAGMDAAHKGGKPIACALPGTTLGIGYELALACHRIFAAPNPEAKIGLPEIKVGLFPGAGGSTRLVRRLGAMGAAPYLLEGQLLSPEKARSAGLIDEIAEDPLEAARAWVLQAAPEDLVKPWDREGFKLPGGGPYHPAGFMTFLGASAMVNGKTKGVYPAAKALLSAVYEGAQVPFDTALRIEARWFTHIMLDPSSSAMIRTLFVGKEALEKGAGRPEGVPPQSVKKLGVLGAGMMGAGIALVAAQAGVPVVLIDRTQEAADKGRAHAEAYLDEGMRRGKTSPEQKQAVLDRLTASTEFDALAGCDMIIEAVFEDPEVKAEVTRKALRHVPESCIFATNTSSLPVSKLAEASLMPENFVGLHFFSPVEKMLLVEVIKGARTGPRAVAKALDFARLIRKTPIVVNDARFFYANRCIIPYLNEGMRLLREGVAPALIENAAKLAGMPLGPLQLVDETSIELGLKIARASRAAMGDAYRDADVDEVLERMAELGRLGRKAGAGFYSYEGGRRRGLWEGLAETWPQAETQPEVLEVQHRLLFVQALEAVRALERHVLPGVREGDVGAVLGWGFAPWSGGPFSWLDMLGAPYAAERATELAERHGRRFACPETLTEMARTGRRFYGP